MIDIVKNHITVYGNEEVRSLVPEICRRLDRVPDIGAVLYGITFSGKQECFEKTSAYIVEHLTI